MFRLFGYHSEKGSHVRRNLLQCLGEGAKDVAKRLSVPMP